MMDQMTLDEEAAARNVGQAGLREGEYLTLQQRYEEWRATEDGKTIYWVIRTRALDLLERGWVHYGIATLWEIARYDRSVRVGPSAGFKLNNDFRSRMAREIMASVPALAGFFETHELKA